MYKDVWKKFGWKMLIAVCSVLLLGGVAFAAPRLQAEEDRTVAGEAEEKAVASIALVSGSAIGKKSFGELHPWNFQVMGAFIYNGNKQPVNTIYYYPDATSADDRGDERYTLSSESDYSYEWNVGNGIDANESAEVNIQARPSSKYFIAGDNTSVACSVPIQKAEITSMYGETAYVKAIVKADNGNEYLTMTNKDSFTLDKSHVTVSIWKDGASYIEIENKDFELRENTYSGENAEVGEKDYKVVLRNYKFNGMNEIPASFSLKKDISTLDIDVEPSDSPRQPLVTVTDGSIKLEGTTQRDYNGPKYSYWTKVEETDDSGINFRVYIYAVEKSNYTGETYRDYHVALGEESIFKIEVLDEKYRKYIDYDENGDYQQDINYLRINDDAEAYVKGVDFDIVSCGFVDSGGRLIQGATAGTVRVSIVGTNAKFRGQKGYFEYYVRRSLRNADITFDPQDLAYTYDKKDHKPDVKVTFKEHPEYVLNSVLGDCTITYSNDLGEKKSDIGNTHDAGTITVEVTGKGSDIEEGYGYYGKIYKTYAINPWEISKDKEYELVLKKNSPDDELPRFEYTGSVPEVEADARIVYKVDEETKININDLKKNKDYSITTSENGKEVGRHTVTFHFKGNYTGTLSAEYEVYAYDLSNSVIELDMCGCGHSGEGDHPYTGEEHRPTVKVYQADGDTPISDKSYDVMYSNNKELGTATVTIKGKSSGSGSQSVTFEIVKRDIEESGEDKLRVFVSDTEYQGSDTIPDIIEMRYGNIVLSPEDYEIIDVKPAKQEGASWKEADYPTFLDSGVESIEYKLKISMKPDSSFKGTAETENTFTFKPRNIEPIGRIQIDGPGDSPKTLDSVAVKGWASRTKLIDLGLNVPMTQDKDFTIGEPEDNKGIVTFDVSGKGHYCGRVEVTFNMGINIAGVVVKENQQDCTKGSDGVVMLNDNYPYRKNQDSYLKFEESPTSTNVVLMYNGKVLIPETDTETTPAKGNYYIGTVGIFPEGGRLYGSIILEGTGNGYYGKLEIRFEITRRNIKTNGDVKFQWKDNKDPDLVYDGWPQYPEFELKDKDAKGVECILEENSDYVAKWDRNTDRGQALLTIEGINCYQGEMEQTFVIAPKELKLEEVTGGSIRLLGLLDSYEYTSETDGVQPEFEVQDIGIRDSTGTDYKVLVNGKDYQVTYENNTRVGTATVIVKALSGNYFGEIRKEFTIIGIDLQKCDIKIDKDGMDFTGKQITIDNTAVHIQYGNEVIPEVYYQLSFSHNIQVGEAYVTISPANDKATGKSILNGTAQRSFRIVGSLRDQVIGDGDKVISETLNEPQWRYYNDSKPVSAKMTFTEHYLDNSVDGMEQYGPYDLDEGEDYQIDKPANMDTIGVKNITVRGIGNYKASYKTTFTVIGNLADITEENYKFDPVLYTGVAAYPKLRIEYGGKLLVEGEDYQIAKDDQEDHVNIGRSSVTLIPTSQSAIYMMGTKTIPYRIMGSIKESNLDVSGFVDKYTYNHGNPVVTENDIKVTLGGTKLDPDADYKISIENNINVGKGTITVTGIEDYTGTVVKNFEIVAYNLTDHDQDLRVDYDHEQTYTGSVIVPTVSAITDVTSHAAIKMDEIEIAEGDKGDRVNYVNYDISPEAQHPTFIVRPKTKNYTGSLSREFTIVQKNLNEEGITVDSINDKPYENGNQIKPMPRVTHGTRPLTAIEYDANKSYADYTRNDGDFVYRFLSDDLRHPGLKEIQITGVGNYTGSVTINFNIIKKDITQEDVTVVFDLEENPVYNGENQIPAFNLMYLGESILRWDGSKLIDQGDKYMSLLTTTVEPGENATNAGNASFIIKTTNNGESDPNYEGERTVQFTIDKLQIQDYTKFFYRPTGSDAIELRKGGYKLSYEFKEKTTVKPKFASGKESGELAEEQVGVYYNNGVLNIPLFSDGNNANKDNDYTVAYAYVEPDTDDTPIREEYSNPDPELSYAGKVKVTISGQNNYSGSASFWYYIGTDISAEGASSLQKTTTVFNAQQQWPVEVVSGLDASKYRIVRYRHALTEENILGEKPVKDKDGGDTKAFIDADTYYIRIEGKPEAGTYSSKPIQLTYTILPRSINRVLIDGYKAEYQYTGSAVCPAGLTVTDPIDEIRYKLTENKDYTISYSNNINAGVASIIIKGQGNYDSGTTATARFTITSSTISSGSSGGNGGGNSAGSSDGSSGQLAGPSSAISADDVRLTMDTSDAMYYTGSAVYPGVYISGMTENIDYTVTFSNNINVGQGIVTIRGINNSSGEITKTFRIIGDLAKCSVAEIPDQAYTGLAVTPGVTVTCGTNTLLQGTDYTLSYANNINIGTASVVITAARDSNYVGSVTVNFSIGNGISSAVVSGYASHYTYTGEPITPAISVAAGSATLRAGTDYTVEYADNTNAGTATMTITGKGVYSGTQKVTFVIEPKSIASCTTTDVSSKKYTGDAYTPAVTVSDGGKTLTNGVDYTVTYANNTNPGVASIIIRALNDNYTGTKTINFRIGTVAVSNFHAGNIKSTSMTLAWTAQDYASGYQICDANSRVVKNSTKNKVTLTGLTSGKTYKYKVRSFIRRADGTRAYGSFSTVISATTKLKTPTVKAASTGKNKARIRWSKVTGATGYQIYYSKSATKGFKKLKTTKNTVRTLNIKGLSSGQRYFFRVRAYKRVGSKNIYSNYNSLKAITVK